VCLFSLVLVWLLLKNNSKNHTPPLLHDVWVNVERRLGRAVVAKPNMTMPKFITVIFYSVPIFKFYIPCVSLFRFTFLKYHFIFQIIFSFQYWCIPNHGHVGFHKKHSTQPTCLSGLTQLTAFGGSVFVLFGFSLATSQK